MACSWVVQQDWRQTYLRHLQAERPSTPYGQWSRCFEPGASQLYDWLRERADPEWIVVSNFHEYLALETGVPTLPIPESRAALDDWVTRIARARQVESPRVLFVLDPDNRWRDYWMPDPQEIANTWHLIPYADAPPRLGARVYTLSDETT